MHVPRTRRRCGELYPRAHRIHLMPIRACIRPYARARAERGFRLDIFVLPHLIVGADFDAACLHGAGEPGILNGHIKGFCRAVGIIPDQRFFRCRIAQEISVRSDEKKNWNVPSDRGGRTSH